MLDPSAFDIDPHGRQLRRGGRADRPGAHPILHRERKPARRLHDAGRELPRAHARHWSSTASARCSSPGRPILINQPETRCARTELSLYGTPTAVVRPPAPDRPRSRTRPSTSRLTSACRSSTRPAALLRFLAGVPLFRKYDAEGSCSSSATSRDPRSTITFARLPTRWP